ncbi:hypothetical protein ACHAWO_006596 [Cyclotella atomus]|uniref:Phosphoglycerate mutase-like protein n=1 Tax=Cyclotella atomus TaxID=382360 RepID=A0ABD3NFU1_9STRA
MSLPPPPQSTPPPKTIYLIRHGVAKHNLPDPITGERPDIANDASLTDPPLVRQGILQAQVLGQNLKRCGIANAVELVICSPLTRCIQTARFAFPDHFIEKSQNAMDDALDEPQDKPGVVLGRNCRVFCHEGVREAFGMHYPDKRRYLIRLLQLYLAAFLVLSIETRDELNNFVSCVYGFLSSLSHLKAAHPNVQFHPNMTENDDAWSPNTRESYNDVAVRVHNFFLWLSRQPQNCIAVVSHGVWMECALMEYFPEVLNNGGKRVYNCDVYAGTMCRGGDGGIVVKDVKQITMYHS